MAKKVPSWFAGLTALVGRGRQQVSSVATAVKQGRCRHWWKQETVWAHAAEPEARKVMHRRATCILCGQVEFPETWKGFQIDVPSEYEREQLLEKASVHE